MPPFATLTEALDRVAAGDGEVCFIDGANDERRQTYKLLPRAAARMLAVLQAEGVGRGSPVVLFVDDSLRFVQFFWAAVLGGAVPVPVAVGGSRAHRDKLVRVWDQLGEPRVVADPDHGARVVEHVTAGGDPGAGQRLAAALVSDRPKPVEAAAQRAPAAPADTALIQFSSGSTGDPKGVVLSHANIAANIHAIDAASCFQSRETAFSWMPLTHDMGLIGFHLTFLCLGHDHVIMRPDLFARRPRLWLEKAAEKQATLLCAPNFGYRYTLRAIRARGLPSGDLSAVRLVYNGAEPIVPALAREFAATLAPTGLQASALFPVYGLAEASLAVAFPEPGRGIASRRVDPARLGVGDAVVPSDDDGALELACLGRPIGNTELAIVDDRGARAPDGVVGHVSIRGDNVTAGYYADPAANAAAFDADGWLDTGDLGFIDDGALVVTGRAKEVIFVNGQNLYPQDLEAVASEAAGVAADRVAAVGARGAEAETVAVFVIHRGRAADFIDTARSVAARLNEYAGVAVARVLPIERLPRTTSGKLQRAALAEAFERGDFGTVAAELDALLAPAEAEADAGPGQPIVAQLQQICDEVAPDKNIGPADDLFEVGLSSLELAQIHEGIDTEWPNRLEVTDLFDYPTLNDLADVLAVETPA